MVTKNIAWNTGSGNITLTYQGQGDGPISIVSDPNDIGSKRSQVITIETTAGTPVITKNVTVSQAACPFPVGDVKNFSYTGSYQEIELPAGQYKLQCWGAQGGSNGTNSSYGITANAGGKGGYSEGVITLSQKTTVRVYVGGKGSSSAGGFNGGGSTTGTSSNSSGDIFGYSKMGGGGGATDIRLSDGSVYSRMIVAGGGSGGAAEYVSKTITTWNQIYNSYTTSERYIRENKYIVYTGFEITTADYYKFSFSGTTPDYVCFWSRIDGTRRYYSWDPNENYYISYNCWVFVAWDSAYNDGTFTAYNRTQTTSTDVHSQVGYFGGGTSGGGYSSTYQGRQNAAGAGGSFGQGADITVSNYMFVSGAGGGGWYGGGYSRDYSNDENAVYRSGGGSGFVNTYANRNYRPSGYTGLQLDSGETKAGNTSFPKTSGSGTETGHSGDGYCKITRLA